MQEVTYRPFAANDFDALARLLAKLWCADLSGRAQELASRIELAGYLAQTTYSCVAEVEGELVGAMLLAELGQPAPEAEVWKARQSAFEQEAEQDAQIAREVARNSGVIEEEEQLAHEFIAAGKPESAAVMKLLVVDPSAQGMGIGGHLFEDAREHLREQGVSGFFLLTDDGCDVSFYQHKGLNRVRTQVSQVEDPAGASSDGAFRLYVYADRL